MHRIGRGYAAAISDDIGLGDSLAWVCEFGNPRAPAVILRASDGDLVHGLVDCPACGTRWYVWHNPLIEAMMATGCWHRCPSSRSPRIAIWGPPAGRTGKRTAYPGSKVKEGEL